MFILGKTTMKIVLLGDIHSQFDKLDAILAKEEHFDLVLSVGDVCVNCSANDTVPAIERYKHKSLAIYGNHDYAVETFPRIPLVTEFSGLKIVGLSGTFKSDKLTANNPRYVTAQELMVLSHEKNVAIFLSHEPCTQLRIYDNNKLVGNNLLNSVIEYMQPQLFVCGHSHQYKFMFYGTTIALSLPLIHKGYALAYFEDDKLANIEVVLRNRRREIRI